MCGINGFINFKYDKKQASQILTAMNQTLAHRGNDDSGTFAHGNAYLGQQRLSIIDLNKGHQPMSYTYHGKTYTIVYNGELYNADEIRDRLKISDSEFGLGKVGRLTYEKNQSYLIDIFEKFMQIMMNYTIEIMVHIITNKFTLL